MPVVLDPQPLVAADELAVVVADQRAGQQVGLAEDLEAVADPEHRHAAPGGLDHLGHHRREPADRPAAQVVAVGEAARQHDRVDLAQVVVAVPERDGVVAADPDGALGVDVVEGAGEGDDPDPHASSSTRTVKFSITGLESSVSAICRDRVEHLVGDLALDLELEPLALAYVAHAGEAEPRQRPVDRLALRVEDLGLGHDVDDDTGHGCTPCGRSCGGGSCGREAVRSLAVATRWGAGGTLGPWPTRQAARPPGRCGWSSRSPWPSTTTTRRRSARSTSWPTRSSPSSSA